MARPNATTEQLMKRFKRMAARLAPTYTLVDSLTTAGYPAVTVKTSGGVAIAYAAVIPFSYSGYNVVGNISETAGEGMPEHAFKLYFDTDAVGADRNVEALFAILAARVGCAVTELYEHTDSPAEGELIDSQLKWSLPASDENGAAGA